MSHPYPAYLAADGSIDRAKVMNLAVAKARQEIALGQKVGCPTSWREAMAEALRVIWGRAKSAHRNVVVIPNYRASLDPVALEIRQHELRIEILTEQNYGAAPFIARRNRGEIEVRRARIAELVAPLAIAAE